MLAVKIGFIGAGQMATALAQGFVRAGLIHGEQLTAHDPASAAAERFAANLPGTTIAASNRAVVDKANAIFLAVKPQHMPTVLNELAPSAGGKLFISVAAGVTLDQLSSGLKSSRVIRVMPNTPCLIGKGASAFALGTGALAEDAKLVEQLLKTVGVVFPVDEKLLDTVTGLSGSGPAFVYAMIEALSDGGVRMGLPRAIATTLAAQTVAGAAEMVLSSGEHPAVLKDRVASPGGTTIAGLHVIEDRGLRGTLISAVVAATERSRELGKK